MAAEKVSNGFGAESTKRPTDIHILMNWKLKALIQNCAELLPPEASYSFYYFMQRHFGNLKRINPTNSFKATIDLWNLIQAQGISPIDKVFLEIGTGRIAATPLALYLLGSKGVITIDLNPYLKEELAKEMLDFIFSHERDILTLFGPALNEQRFKELKNYYSTSSFSLDTFLKLCDIKYIAPGDAAETGLPTESIDLHISITVLEHIPKSILTKILKEGNRIIKRNGLFAHRIDYSDHFSHSDSSITRINFLKYSDEEWAKLAGNRFMYMNRLRHDDFLQMFKAANHTILVEDKDLDAKTLELLTSTGIKLNALFLGKTKETLSITGAWIVSERQD